jgi:soluble lytic murein transglycosylase-like protein
MTPPTSDDTPPRSTWLERLLVRGSVVVTGVLLVSALGAWSQRTRAAEAAAASDTTVALTPAERLAAEQHDAAVAVRRLARAQAVLSYAARYRIPAELSGAIYDNAVAEGIQPAIAYRLVQVESNFKRTARSSAGAMGFTQIQVATARHYDRTVTETKLMNRDLNLRLGFRYLKDLMVQFDHDSHLALLAYNRGPARVEQILEEGGNPRNGYSSAVLKAYRPTAPARGVSN